MRSEFAASLALQERATHRQLINVRTIRRSYPRPLWSRFWGWLC